MIKQPRIHQQDAIEKTIGAIENKTAKNQLVLLHTGSGKTLAIALTILQLMKGGDVLVLSHVKEILEQDRAEFETYIIDVCVYSAGLGSREVGKVTVAGIQSGYDKPDVFKHFKYIVIDEAHRCNEEEGMYATFFNSIREDHVRIGYTATDYRAKGYIHGPGMLFDKVVCNWCTPKKYKQLVDLKYLSPIVLKRTKQELDATGIKFVCGDYSIKQQSDKFDRRPITEACCKEIITAGRNRKKWMVFAIDIEHAEHIAEFMIKNGISTTIIHSKMKKLYGFDRDEHVRDLKANKYRCVITVDVLTTGFDDPSVDLIACLSLTNSAQRHVQIMGRGARVCDGKEDCLFMDFAQNCIRLGTIDNPNIKAKGKGLKGGDPVMKPCPDCDVLNFISTKHCVNCNHEFKFTHKLSTLTDAMDDGEKGWFKVYNTDFVLKTAFGRPSIVEVRYDIGMVKPIVQLVCLEHQGFARDKARHWVKVRSLPSLEANIVKCKDLMNNLMHIKRSKMILVQRKGKYTDILDSKFDLE